MWMESARGALWACCVSMAWAQAPVDDEAEALRRDAAALAEAEAPPPRTAPARSANALNPEISATADMAALGRRPAEGEGRFDFVLRSVEVDLRASLDPFSRFRAIVAAHGDGVFLEEAHVTWGGVAPGVTVVGGRFRQALGTVNRWHDHGVDQLERPLVLRALLGDEGLAQTGLGVSWLAGAAEATSTLTLEVTNSERDPLFSGALPAALLAWAGHFGLGERGYLELQLAGLHGYHAGGASTAGDGHGHEAEEAEIQDAHETDDDRATDLASLTLDVGYDPAGGRDRFRFFWRSQGLYLSRDEGGGARSHRLGAFSYVEAWLSGAWGLGVRFDVLGETRDDPGLGEATLGVAPVLTWWQSEFVRLRLQYRAEGGGLDALEHVVALQVVGAVGPHRHERY